MTPPVYEANGESAAAIAAELDMSWIAALSRYAAGLSTAYKRADRVFGRLP
jgi:hypothetical protein